jgi:hypothetical protein
MTQAVSTSKPTLYHLYGIMTALEEALALPTEQKREPECLQLIEQLIEAAHHLRSQLDAAQ